MYLDLNHRNYLELGQIIKFPITADRVISMLVRLLLINSLKSSFIDTSIRKLP